MHQPTTSNYNVFFVQKNNFIIDEKCCFVKIGIIYFYKISVMMMKSGFRLWLVSMVTSWSSSVMW